MEHNGNLDGYVERFKNNKKLSVKDTKDIKEILVNGLILDSNHYVQYLFSFSPEIAAKAFANAWGLLSSEDQRQILSETFSRLVDGTPARVTRGVSVARELLPQNHGGAFRILSNVCEKATDGGRKVPNIKLLSIVREMCLSAELLSIPPSTLVVTELDITCVSVVVVHALCSTKESKDGYITNSDSDLVQTLLWLEQFGRKAQPVDAMMKKVQEITFDWRIEDKLSLQRLGLIPPENKWMTMRIATSEKIAKSEPERKAVESSESIRGLVNRKSIDDVLLPLHHFVQSLDRHVLALEQKVQLLTSTVDAEKATRMRVEIQNKELRDQVQELQVENAHLNRYNKEFQKRVEHLSKDLEQHKISHMDERQRLIDMSEHEAEYVVQEFRNKVTKTLRTEYLDFSEIQNESITPELGENIRIQLGRIFKILNEAGMKFR